MTAATLLALARASRARAAVAARQARQGRTAWDLSDYQLYADICEGKTGAEDTFTVDDYATGTTINSQIAR